MNKDVRTAVKSAIVVAVLAFNVFYYTSTFSARKNGIDFPQFYCAAKMVLAGQGHGLYDIALQQQFQARYTGRLGVIFNHPPFETLLYAPAASLDYSAGYLLWSVVGTLLIAGAMYLLNRSARVFADAGPLVMLAFVYAPVTLDLLQGQDAAILLLIYAIVYVTLRENKEFAAGCALAAGVFKPQLVLPFLVIVLLARKSWKFLQGFAAVALLLGLVSMAVSGWHALLRYPSFVLSLTQVGLAGYHPREMANWRGLLSLVVSASARQVALLITGSLALVWCALHSWSDWKSESSTASRAAISARAFDLAFSNTMVVTLLVSYHVSPHDLTLLLIPIALSVRYLRQGGMGRDPVRLLLALLLLALFLPPLYVITLALKSYALMSIPMLLFCGCLTISTGEPHAIAFGQSGS